MSDLRILAWAINEDRLLMEEMCAPMMRTASLHRVEVELFGIGTRFVEHKQRVALLRDYLLTISDPENTIIVCIDGSDTLFNDDTSTLLDRFLEKETRVLISAEKDFMHQYDIFRENFDRIPSPYRYVNAGTFMGYADALLRMFEEMLVIDQRMPGNDQGLMGIWAHRHLANPALVQLDTSCDVFWVTSCDWESILELPQNRPLLNPHTGSRPVIIHAIGGNDRNTITGDSYRHLYRALTGGGHDSA